MGEDVEEHAARVRWEPERVEILPCGLVVVTAVGPTALVAEHGQRCETVDTYQVAEAEGRRAPGQRDHVPRRFVRQTGERLDLPAGTEDRVVVERLEKGKLVVDPTQQGLEVVVLAEEGVEAPLHLEGLAAGEPVGPRPGAPAEKVLALREDDRDATFGQHHRRRHSGETAAGDHRGQRRGNALMFALSRQDEFHQPS